MTACRRRFPTRERGQATVELALALPMVAMALLLVVQVLVVGVARLRVQDVTRDAARTAAVSSDPPSSVAAILNDRLPGARSTVAGGPSTITVTLRYRIATDVPLVGQLVPDVEVVAQSSFRREAAGWSGASSGRHPGASPRSRRPP